MVHPRKKVGPRDSSRRAMAGAMQSMFSSGCTSKEYVTRRLWLEAGPPQECPYCSEKELSCSLVLHGYYDRVHPKGARVRRYRCTRTGRTVSMLPDCLLSHVYGDVDTLEEIAIQREAKASLGKIAEGLAKRLHKRHRTLEGTLRLVKRRLAAVSIFVVAVVSLRPEQFEEVGRDLGMLRGHLKTGRVLVELRHLAGDQLDDLDPPLGLRPRPWNALEAGSGQFHKARGYRGPPGLGDAPDEGKRNGRSEHKAGTQGREGRQPRRGAIPPRRDSGSAAPASRQPGAGGQAQAQV